MNLKISQRVGGEWTGMDEGARVSASVAGGAFQPATVTGINRLGGLVRVRFDSGTESWLGRSNVVLVTPATAPATVVVEASFVEIAPPTVAAIEVAAVEVAAVEMPVAGDATVTEEPVADVAPLPVVADAPLQESPAPTNIPTSSPLPSVSEDLPAPPSEVAPDALPPAVAPDVRGSPMASDWQPDVGTVEVRSVLKHLAKHGAITEAEATKMLGSARAFRRFSMDFDMYMRRVPFRVRIEATSDGKRYVKDGDK